MNRFFKWLNRVMKRGDRLMFPGMFKATEEMRVTNKQFRAALEEMGVDVEAELKKMEENGE